METMKKEWGKPLTDVQEFVPSEFCAPCGDGATEVTYYFMCDGGVASDNYDAWLDDRPKNGALDGGWVLNWQGRYQWSSTGDTWLTYYKNGRVYHYYPCNERHVVTVPADYDIDQIFPMGFIQLKNPYSDGHNSGPVTPVRIWRGDNNSEVHCTTQLKSESYTPHNPS